MINTETSSGVTAIEAISAADDGYSRWVVGGTLTGSDLQVDVLSGADLEVGDILTDVLIADTIAGDWGDWVVFDDLRNDFAVLINNASTALSLILEERYTFLDIVDTTNLTYARGAAEALDQIDAAGTDAGTDMAGVIEALDDLPSFSFNDAARAIAQFTPITNVAWYTTQLAEQVSDAINDRMSGLSSSSGYASGSAMPGNNHVWVKVLGTDTKQDNTDNLPGYDADSYGFALGFDTQAHDQQWLVGGAFAYTNAKLDANTISKNHVEMDGYQVAAYGNYPL